MHFYGWFYGSMADFSIDEFFFFRSNFAPNFPYSMTEF